MTYSLLARISLMVVVCGLTTACKTAKSSAEAAESTPVSQSSDSAPEVAGADTSAPADAELDFTRHTVRKGDTFYAIARQYGADVKDVMAANPSVEPTALRIGQEILVPVSR